jgi:hypothetical protein
MALGPLFVIKINSSLYIFIFYSKPLLCYMVNLPYWSRLESILPKLIFHSFLIFAVNLSLFVS